MKLTVGFVWFIWLSITLKMLTFNDLYVDNNLSLLLFPKFMRNCHLHWYPFSCSVFSKVADDADILKAVCFQGVSVYNRGGLFQQTNGLLHRCAQVGNAAAQYLLAKVMILCISLSYV